MKVVPSWKKWVTWGREKGAFLSPGPSCYSDTIPSYLVPSYSFGSDVLPCTWPKAKEPANHGLKPWTKRNSSLPYYFWY